MRTAVHTRLALLPPAVHANDLRTRSANALVHGFCSRPRRLCACSSSEHSGHGGRSSGAVPQRQYRPPWFSVAPMMDWTDTHFRTLARFISKHAWLYTEMVVAETIVHQKDSLDRFLAFPPEQHPIVLQIGGSNLENLSKAAQLANAYCYDEINLNCGCPSGKVAGHGCFGARLMLDPKGSLSGRLCQPLLLIAMFLSVLNAGLVLMTVTHIVTSVTSFIRLLLIHRLGIS